MKKTKRTESVYHFYMWVHPYTGMTCYGITSNLDHRQRNYQGGNGFDIEWKFLATGSEDEIKKLERTLKNAIKDVESTEGRKISYGEYEWISSEVEYDSIVDLINSFIDEDIYETVKVIKDSKIEVNDE